MAPILEHMRRYMYNIMYILIFPCFSFLHTAHIHVIHGMTFYPTLYYDQLIKVWREGQYT